MDDQRGSPTYVGHLAAATREVLAAAVRRLPRRGRRRLHVGRLRGGDLRRGRARLPRAPDLDRRARRGRRRGPRTRCCGARRARRRCRTGARACASASPSVRRRRSARIDLRWPATRFLTTWSSTRRASAVWDAIYETERWPEWWRGVKRAEQLERGDGDGVGSLHRYEWRSGIPYDVAFQTRITRIERPHLIEGGGGRGAARDRPLALLRRPRDRRHLRVGRRRRRQLDEPARARSAGRSSAGTTTSSCTRAAGPRRAARVRASWPST